MNIALLHGAIKNAGDYLIKNRAIDILKYYYPECVINEFYRNESLNDKIDELNSNDIIIFAGGPGYYETFYPELAPFVDNLDDIKIPIMIMGMGWYGDNTSVDTIYSETFRDKMKSLLKRVSNDTNVLGCRDYYSVDILRNNGFDGGLMTGCPAWYNLEKINEIKYRGKSLNDIKKICVSDCGNVKNIASVLEVLIFLRKFFADAEISLVCHRDDVLNHSGIMDYLNNIGIIVKNIAGSDEGFKIYDDCDIHIGFRVHAHIYNLSERRLSILVEEDGRGAGVNDALGLPNIRVYKSDVVGNKKNDKIIFQLEDYMLNLITSDYMEIERAFETMCRTYKQMEKFVLSISKYVK